MAKFTGIGGVFFKSKEDPAALAAWNLGRSVPMGVANAATHYSLYM